MKKRKARIEIRSDTEAVLREMAADFKKVWRTGKPGTDVYTFSTPAQLFETLPPKRWELIEKLQAIGPVSLRALARALERDVKRVHEDVAALIEWGLIERTAPRKIQVPYEVIHVDFDLRAAA